MPTYRRVLPPFLRVPLPVGPVDLPAPPAPTPRLPQTPARRGPAAGPTAATSASCGCQGKQSFRKAGAGGGCPRKLRRACQLPAVGFRFQGAGGGWSSGRGRGVDARAQSLAWSWSGRGLIPWGSSRRAPPVPVCSCPLPSSCPRPLPTLPRICWASCLAGPGALLAPRTCSLDPEPQLGACSDPALLSPAGSGEQWSLPALLSEGRGSPGLEPVRLALGWHFLSPPPPSLAEAGRELVGVPQLPSGGPGRGGRRKVLEGFLEKGARAVGGCWLGECPPPPRGSPGSSAWPCSSLHTALTGNSPPQEATCACTVGTVSDFAECNLSPLPWALQSLLCSGC